MKRATILVPPVSRHGDSASTDPPMARTSSATMARPSPEPICLAGVRADWWKRSNTLGRSAAGIPSPSSTTVTVTSGPWLETSTSILDAANLKAFSTRLATTWASLSGSAATVGTVPSGTRTDSSSPAALVAGRKPSAVSATTSATSTWRTSKEKRAASSLARSSRSPTRRSSRRDSLAMILAARSTSVVAPSEMASAKPRIDVRGVRRSWETDMRNWRSSPRERLRLAAMELMERVSEASSG